MPDDGASPVPAEESRHDRRRHRRLILEPKEGYSVRDAAEILCMRLRPKVRPYVLDSFRKASACYGDKPMASDKSIETALGADLADAIPELLRLADLEVASPASRSWPWNASPTATASPSTPSSRARVAGCRVRELGVPGHGHTGLHRGAPVAAIGRTRHAKRRSDPPFRPMRIY